MSWGYYNFVPAMEVRIISKEMVKPSSKAVYNRKPFSLSLLDQFVPAHYIPLICFYSKPNDSSFNTTAQILVGLKESRYVRCGSRLLPPFDPIPEKYVYLIERIWFDEGWYKTRRFVFDDQAIATLKFRVKSKRLERPSRTLALAAFLWKHAMLASRAACWIKGITVENIESLLPFVCVPTSTSFQITIQINVFDCGGIAIAFCSSHKVMDATTASTFIKRWYKTRRFVFDDQAIATLKFRVKSKRLERPSRTLALVAFLWKHAMLASRAACGLSKPSVLTQPVNLRTKMNPGLPSRAIGNPYNEETDVISQDDVEIFDCVSWTNTLDSKEIDFGWGPVTGLSLGCPGTRYNSFDNSFILNGIEKSKGIEAVITLESKIMDILVRDSEFLALASPK
ncbi:hypothetical protein F3Y22_tig00111402pilonHSYRG01168 [Hibiscus syriacus]|uniref:Uncharacterized protein n=1 Tax=Hibiscus syriacus TaxID=106335 RepID=A0A6A2Y593_HIBSY|nr:hypothetical protein F3Y22_tig00111402pilonHSYRG01168 [Hibiscus syriacus]